MTASTYTQDGVNLKAGDAFSAYAAEVCKSTYRNSRYIEMLDNSDGHFRGPRTLHYRNLPEGCSFGLAPDGIGTKVVLIDSALSHNRAAWDLIAMTCGDIDRWGGLPVIFSNVLDIKTLGENGSVQFQRFQELMIGLGEAANRIEIVVPGGETAELGPCVSSENPNATTQFNWAGFALGIFPSREKMITGKSLAAGQIIVAIKEDGFRSNGISSVRKALALQYGKEWYNNPDAHIALFYAATPSKLHTNFFATLNGWRNPEPNNFEAPVRIHLISHITGGSIKSKFAELVFAHGLSAHLDNLWEPPQIMKSCGEWRNMDDQNFYETWNGGQGALFVIDEKDFETCRRIADLDGLSIIKCGEIIPRRVQSVTIESKYKGGYIEYHPDGKTKFQPGSTVFNRK